MSPLSELQARVEAAVGPDRELDARVAEAMGWTSLDGLWGTLRGLRPVCPNSSRVSEVPYFTADLNAVLALVGERLPHAWPTLKIPPAGRTDLVPAARLHSSDEWVQAKTPALALLSALLKALDDSGSEGKG